MSSHRLNIYVYIYIYAISIWVLFSLVYQLCLALWRWEFDTRMLVTFGICFDHHFDTRYLVSYNPSPPRIFLSLDLLSEYRIPHGAIGPLYVTSSYSTWILCRGVSGFATDCPCDVWCRGLTTCLLHVGPPFVNGFLNKSWAVGLTWWIGYLHFFRILPYAIIYVLIHHIIFWLYLYFLNILYLFFKHSCTNIFHRRSLCTCYSNRLNINFYVLLCHCQNIFLSKTFKETFVSVQKYNLGNNTVEQYPDFSCG